jgi:hypothetical protein
MDIFLPGCLAAVLLRNVDFYQFQIKDAIKAARIEAMEAYNQYVEEPKTSQRRGGFDLELVLNQDYLESLP